MKYIVVIALLAVMPALADWRWEGREQARQAVAEARRARAEAMREVAQARREVRREMDSAHREWRTELRQAQAEVAREMRQFRDEMRRAIFLSRPRCWSASGRREVWRCPTRYGITGGWSRWHCFASLACSLCVLRLRRYAGAGRA